MRLKHQKHSELEKYDPKPPFLALITVLGTNATVCDIEGVHGTSDVASHSMNSAELGTFARSASIPSCTTAALPAPSQPTLSNQTKGAFRLRLTPIAPAIVRTEAAPMRSTPILRRRPVIRALILTFLLIHVVEIALILRSSTDRAQEVVTRRSERIYITSLHWNNEEILRSHWNAAVVALATALGPDNVFVTVYESGSWDESRAALTELDAALAARGIRHNITLSRTTHLDEISAADRGRGWVDTPRGRRELRRIPYLARLRNLAMEPLQELVRQGESFDKTEDVFRLLDTNGGDYAAACSLDFSKPPNIYDTFALRDSDGHELLMQKWPYFRARQSRRALLANRPVPVSSCWNGMVAMPAEPFAADPPLRFRGIPDSLSASHLEGSECCLVHVDNPLQARKQTYVNPQVLVGYSGEAYDAVHPQPLLQSSWRISAALWESRVRRWFTSPWLKEWTVRRRVERWRAANKDRKEGGESAVTHILSKSAPYDGRKVGRHVPAGSIEHQLGDIFERDQEFPGDSNQLLVNALSTNADATTG
ncbi:hypothetical protein OPT61_g10212 [Boeremia exigua]|uniref:Uncharacterized protein n=1 Tax=Boeremia exigua TaxID=749465 RepID=A0ACC2HRD4_9PLEO|nr:hypothetical protein OPT61_g10212 [Boeremia exigua]